MDLVASSESEHALMGSGGARIKFRLAHPTCPTYLGSSRVRVGVRVGVLEFEPRLESGHSMTVEHEV